MILLARALSWGALFNADATKGGVGEVWINLRSGGASSIFVLEARGKGRRSFFSPFTEKKTDLGLGVNGFKKKRRKEDFIAVYTRIPRPALRNNRPSSFVIKKAGLFFVDM